MRRTVEEEENSKSAPGELNSEGLAYQTRCGTVH